MLLQITIIGSGFTGAADMFAITFGNTTCGDVVVLNSSALQCTTQKPTNSTVPQGPLDVKVRSCSTGQCTRATALPSAIRAQSWGCHKIGDL
jgi:hypothetical protein